MSILKSIYEEAILQSYDLNRTVDITNGIISFDYYEDIFSPTITAKMKVMSAGNVIDSERDGYNQSIYNGLPLRGGERLSLKVAGNSQTNPGLDFTNPRDYLYVSGISDVITESQRESFTLNFVSREAVTNETSRVTRKYPTSSSIDQSVTSILKDYLKTENIGIVEKTSNPYGFIGNLRKPFTVLVWLAAKSVPTISGSATAGFVFYQTKDGFQFRSIDGLAQQKPKFTYQYSGSNISYDQEDKKINNDFKILNYHAEKNQNLVEKLRLGTYASQRMFFNPLNFSLTQPERGNFKLEDYAEKTKNLGRDINLPPVSEGSDKTLGDLPSRIITAIFDIGTFEKDSGKYKDVNSNPELNQSQALMRYNTLLTQSVNMIVSSNTNLRAGDVIECLFPIVTQSDENVYDPETSGLYMIKELCHHFDTERSYTSMKLVRDTFGVNTEARTE